MPPKYGVGGRKGRKSMEERTGRKIRFIYAVLFSVFTVIIGILCMAQAWSIFKSADSGAYTRASVWKHFKEIALPIALYVCMLVGNIVLACMYPAQKEKLKAEVPAYVTYKRLKAKVGEVEDGKKFRTRRIAFHIAIVAIAIAFLAIGITIMFVDNYDPMLSAAFFLKHDCMVDRLVRVAIFAIVGLALCALLVLLSGKTLQKEIAVYKAALVAKAKSGEKVNAVKEEKSNDESTKKWIFWTRIALFAVAIVCIITGATNGGLNAMFVKAINICTQCIGIG